MTELHELSATDFPGVQHAYRCGLVADVFRRERDSRLRGPSVRPVVSAHMIYAGSEVPPFEVYMRWYRDNRKIVLATIAAEDQRRGRMPAIMDALEAMSPVVEVEAVGNPHLARWLYARGYRMEPIDGWGQMHGYPGNYSRKSDLSVK